MPMQLHDVSEMFSFVAPVYKSTVPLIVVNQNAAPSTPILQPTPILVIPFWTIVIPLTLVAAYLPLSKPRVRFANSLSPTTQAPADETTAI